MTVHYSYKIVKKSEIKLNEEFNLKELNVRYPKHFNKLVEKELNISYYGLTEDTNHYIFDCDSENFLLFTHSGFIENLVAFKKERNLQNYDIKELITLYNLEKGVSNE
jgi:esterase/lipase superfamily enzyme